MVVPKSIINRVCPECGTDRGWSILGFAYGGGDDSKWKCLYCNYVGKPKYMVYEIEPHLKVE